MPGNDEGQVKLSLLSWMYKAYTWAWVSDTMYLMIPSHASHQSFIIMFILDKIEISWHDSNFILVLGQPNYDLIISLCNVHMKNVVYQ